jgi:hypothetical protein
MVESPNIERGTKWKNPRTKVVYTIDRVTYPNHDREMMTTDKNSALFLIWYVPVGREANRVTELVMQYRDFLATYVPMD